MLLNEPCPTSIEFNGIEYDVDMSFNNVLDALRELNNGKGFIHVQIALATFIDEQEVPQGDEVKLLEKILEDLVGQASTSKVVVLDRLGNVMPSPSGNGTAERVYDLDYDASYIFTSFYQAYHIDLFEMSYKLHWAKFQMLLRDLPKETMFSEIVRIRQAKLSDYKDKERKHMEEQKRRYRLPDIIVAEGS